MVLHAQPVALRISLSKEMKVKNVATKSLSIQGLRIASVVEELIRCLWCSRRQSLVPSISNQEIDADPYELIIDVDILAFRPLGECGDAGLEGEADGFIANPNGEGRLEHKFSFVVVEECFSFLGL